PLSGAVEGLVRNWTFEPSAPTMLARLARLRTVIAGPRPAPESRALRALTARDRWNAYFLFLPDGQLSAAHRYTLHRLRALRGGLLAIVATSSPGLVPRELLDTCDAVYWKGESGYDFSAYARVFREIALRSEGADLLLLNDSVLGPFCDLDTILARSPWGLTGFTAWSAFEHHVQSYALYWRRVVPATTRSLRTVLPARVAFNRFQDVVNWQETRLARVASRTMSVGALWFEPDPNASDPSIARAVPLVVSGFPFLKRSLVGGKLANRADQQRVRNLLEERGHPA
ncbi:MAG TPA: hypothetical protein VM032_03370, partial [Vicinamibacterales bacterium]|nr:hypothetical protein [Vicinamibacterales bacterium]